MTLPLDSNYELEQQFILRLPPNESAALSKDIDSGVNLKDNLTIEFRPDMRNSILRYNGQFYKGTIVDLPCIIESMKTTDRKTFYKTADISQMMICTQDERKGPLKGTTAYLEIKSNKASSSFNRENREFQYLHGLTPPLKNVLRRRFRKTRRKRFLDMPKIEKEVKDLLKLDLDAESVKWSIIWSEPPSGSQASFDGDKDDFRGRNVSRMREGIEQVKDGADDDSDEESSRRRRDQAIDKRDVFGELSSSSCSSQSSGLDDDDDDTNQGRSRKSKNQIQRDQEDSQMSKKSNRFLLSSAASDLDESSNLAQQLQLSDDSNADQNAAVVDSNLDFSDQNSQLIRNLGDEEEDATAAQIMTSTADQEHNFCLDEDSNQQFNLLADSVDLLQQFKLNQADDFIDESIPTGGELLPDTYDESALMSFPSHLDSEND